MDEEQIKKIATEIATEKIEEFKREFIDLQDSFTTNRYSFRRIFEAGVELQSRFFIKDRTLAQITANQDDYEIGNSTVLRLSTDASRDITGLKGGIKGRVLIIINTGAEDIVLKDEDASSIVGNRIATHSGADITLGTEDGAFLFYDITSLRWRLILNS